MIKKKSLYFMLVVQLIIGCSLCSLATEDESSENEEFTPNVFPPPPNAASLGKYGNYDANVSNGKPNINIPIWEIKAGDFTLPISLSYNAAGIKVEEIASRVGLGWSLNAGGVITRTVRDLPDESRDHNTAIGFFHRTSNLKTYHEWEKDGEAFMRYIFPEGYGNRQMPRKEQDTEPDFFYYNVNGHSGRFVFDQEGEIHKIPETNIDIKDTGFADVEHTVFKNLDGWILRTPDGVKYIFDRIEKTGQKRVKYAETDSSSVMEPSYRSSWYLTEIVLPNSEKITFSYKELVIGPYKRSISDEYWFDSEIEVLRGNYRSYSHFMRSETVIIDSITYRDTKIKFNSDEARKDLIGDYVINSIEILEGNQPVRKFELDYNYLYGTDLLGSEEVSDIDDEFLRLVLCGIQEKGEGVSKKPYEFSYYQGEQYKGLPSRFSKAQDHWGYYNGKTGNSRLCPHVHETTMSIDYSHREPDLNSCKTGTLSRIKFPTGGYTDFSFELHDVKLHSREIPDFYKYEDSLIATIKSKANIQGCLGVFNYEGVTNEFVLDNPCNIKLERIVGACNSSFIGFDFTSNPYSTWPVTLHILSENGDVVFSTDDINKLVCQNDDNQEYVNKYRYLMNQGLYSIYLDSGRYTLEIIKNSGVENETEFGKCRLNYIEGTGEDSHDHYIFSYNVFKDVLIRVEQDEESETTDPTYKIGGLRVKSITSYAEDGHVANKKTYEYSLGGESTGECFIFPQYDIYPIGYRHLKCHVVCDGFYEKLCYYLPEYTTHGTYYELKSSSSLELPYSQGCPVAYYAVKTIYENNGYKLQYFRNEENRDYLADYFSFQGMFKVRKNHTNCPPNELTSLPIYSLIRHKSSYDIIPFPPVDDCSYLRGIPEKDQIYREDGNIAKEIIYDYKIHNWHNNDNIQRQIFGLRKGTFRTSSAYPSHDPNYIFSYYTVSWGYKELKSVRETDFDIYGTKTSSKFTEYSYKNMLVSEKKTTGSDGTVRKVTYKYPTDYLAIDNVEDNYSAWLENNRNIFTEDYSVFYDMLEDYIISPVIEETSSIESGGKKEIVSSVYKKYSDVSGNNSGVYKPKEIYKLSVNKPLDANKEKLIDIVFNNDSLDYILHDSYCLEIIFDIYDNNGNLLQYQKVNNNPTSIIWGYNNSYPIAKVENAENKEVYFSGFEYESSERISDYEFHSGRKSTFASVGGGFSKSFNTSYSLNDAELCGKFVFSGWVKTSGDFTGDAKFVLEIKNDEEQHISGSQHYLNTIIQNTNNEWQYFEVIFDFDKAKEENPDAGVFNLSGYVWNCGGSEEVFLDDIRFHPADALMTTYTYDPLIGVTSETDPNGRTTYYKYDGLGRLEYIIDNEGNVLKKNEYNYKDQ